MLQLQDDEPVRPAERPVVPAMMRGFKGRCPACGEGRLFGAFLKPVDHCSDCGEAIHHHRADDFPPYIVVTIMGHVVIAGYMATDVLLPLTSWQHLAIWAPVTLIGSLALMQPVKGAVIGLQWALRMHGFGGHPDRPEDVLPPAPEPRRP
ncbi:hypothetical protein BJF92_23225 [Rhizobium rhizosphaerae]|uniref:DUF983 domain-containing protein n=1 Tax=Xaviernesmea rhizosphaerae TaxID=1672749 RepID=A0A1Q9AJN0_9HYPH|nr:DUF983 domain-containing protein [Xaviernesmea rhizosphaerae]OLP55455.1 hypothetical protein BJF92_23225 [Xaviernesmea rhizosphaerae]